MFTKRSWESFYSGLIIVGLVFMVFPVIYFCGATKEKQILPPLIMFLLGLVIFVISVHFSVKYHKEKTKYTKYKIDKSLTYTFTLTYGDKVETVTDFSQIEYAIKWLAKYRTGHVEIAVTPTMGSLKKFYICYTDKDPYIHMLIEQEREDGVGYWEERGDSYKIPIMTLERLYVKHKMISFDYLKYIEAGLIVTSLIMFVVSLFVDYENTGLEAAILIIGTAVISVIAEKINKKEIEKMKCQEEEELKDIV